jgi:hypothetical protein
MPADAASIDAIDVALIVAGAVEAVGGEYFVGGSLASSLQGEPRATNDVDIVVSLPLGRLTDFVASLGADFEVDLDMFRDAMLRGSCCNIFYLPLLTKVDLFARGGEPFDESEFSRRRVVQVRASGERLVVKSAEDTVLRKLLWFRAGGEVSERQWCDVVQVLRVGGNDLEASYLDAWAVRLRIETLLARARADASSA